MEAPYRVLLIGAGNFGQRYIDGTLSTELDIKLFVLDKNETLLKTLSKKYEKVSNKVIFINSIALLKHTVSLCIIATTSNQRYVIFNDILARRISSNFLLEKVVFQKYSHFEKIINSLSDKPSINVWVNHPRRYISSYRHIRAILSNKASIQHISVKGFNWNMGSNLVHILDIIEYISGKHILDMDFSGITKVVGSKRSGFLDLYGVVTCQVDNQEPSISIENNKHLKGPFELAIKTSLGDILVKESSSEVIHNLPDCRIDSFKPFIQSQDFSLILSSILTNRTSDLPLLVETQHIYKILLPKLTQFINHHLNKNYSYCPIT